MVMTRARSWLSTRSVCDISVFFSAESNMACLLGATKVAQLQHHPQRPETLSGTKVGFDRIAQIHAIEKNIRGKPPATPPVRW